MANYRKRFTRFSAPTVTVLVNNDGMIEEVAIPDDVLNSLTDYRQT